jgi:hypothetical protein
MAHDATRANPAGDQTGHDHDDWYDDDDETTLPRRKGNRERRRDRAPRNAKPAEPRRRPARRGPTRAAREGRESFKCGHCRAFVGPTIGGGRHRNHCPLCLHSRHLDGARPGDRAGGCGATMAPIARFDRRNGEPVLVHRCLGCGFERHNRLAADDNLVLLTRLPLVGPRGDRGRDTGDRRAS